ncbi:hypothetical protein ELE36_15210 [Pseudolysobacter antarcticus]|uniref:Uncharacterized protein n=1 Tax=Pseudolysobacter antarcticus TaxID=2511995 RepID=A0A411HM49_9GAMM|nr:hypothetical protein [Pseudolysobacter antarcticus]QBB71596.1 hypothetical protein ELE36_15210 [Pseudolysobacter antarcticus]
MKKHWRIFLLVSIAAAIGMYVALDRHHLSVATTATPAAPTPPSALLAKTPTSTTAPTAIVAQANTLSPMKVRQNKANAYSATRDLSAYIDKLQTDGSSEDEILTTKARAMEECFLFAIRPNYAAEAIESRARITQENSAQFREYIATLSQRCSALIQKEQVSLKTVRSNYAKAASEGNAEAMAYQLSRAVLLDVSSDDASSPATTTPSVDLRQKIIDIVNSGDPSAIFLLSGLFNENSLFRGKAVGSAVAEAAWQLAACDLGLDCSENSVLLRGYCINGGVYCESGDLRWHIRELTLAPVMYQRAVVLEAEIYAAIQSGNASSLF